MVIATEALRKSYPKTEALRGVDLQIEEGGAIVGLLGPNGAGKTTLVEILEGLRTPTSGKASVLGLDPATQPRELRGRVGVQLQSTALPQDLTASEVVALFGAFYTKPRRPEDVLAQVGLGEKARARVRTLSGGQRQRLALALAMVHDPELFILDEPTTGLDPVARRGIHEILRELRARRRTVLVTSHYVEEIEQLADRVLVLRDGSIVADGTPLALMARSSGRSTLWIDVDGEMDTRPLLEAGVTAQGRDGAHLKFSAPEPAAAVMALAELLRAQSLALRDLRLRRPTLEDVYLELVGGAKEAA
jgi:ABC-2 type transport system ATP-binding protein